VAIDQGVLLFAILCACATTMIFGSVAALHSRHDLSSGLKEAGRTGSEAGSKFVQKAMITLQVAFSFVLLVAAGLMVRSFVHILQVNPGFVPQNVFAISLGLNGNEFMDNERLYSLTDRIQQDLGSLPGVMSVAVSSSFPLDPDNMMFGGQTSRFQVEGDPRPLSELPPIGSIRRVSPAYFKTIGIPLISGRVFRDSDNELSPAVVLVNRNLAQKRWGKEDPIGKRITFDNGENWMTIVGIVGDVKEFGLNRETPYQLYRPLRQNPFPGSVLVRTAGDPVMMAQQIRRKLREVEPKMAIARMMTLEQARADSVSSPRTLAHLFGLFAILAMIIAVSGCSSMLALWVKQRMREIGIRLALGASPRQILFDLVRQGMILVVSGLAIGFAGALIVTRMLDPLLFQVKPTDLATYALVCALLLLGAFIACYVPARRAMKVDPMIALRYE
jgi:putative ABC transport system permease protein